MPNRRFWLLLAALVVPACGSGGGGGSIVPLGPPGPTIIQVYPKGWTGAEMIETKNEILTAQDLAISGNGEGFVVWVQNSAGAGSRFDIWSNHYVPGVGWTGAELIEHQDVGPAYNPKVAADPFGNAVVVWAQSSTAMGVYPQHLDGWAARYVSGSGWQAPQLIETGNGNAGDFGVACDASGNAMAVWTQIDDGTTTWSVWANRYVAGVGWGTAELIESDTATAWNVPVVGVDGSGNAIAVFQIFDGVRFNLWANRHVPGAGWQGAVSIETIGIDIGNFQLAVSANGAGFVAWSAGGAPSCVYLSRYVPGAGWQPQDPIMDRSDTYAYDPSVAADGAGDVIVVWSQHDQGTATGDLWAQRYVAGLGWEAARTIETYSAGAAGPGKIAMNAAGDALVVWPMSDGHVQNIWSNRYVVGIGWDAAREIETQDLGHAVGAIVAIDPQSKGLAVWQQYDGAFNNLWSNRYE